MTMTDNTHPITPSPELVKKWIEDWAGAQMKGIPSEEYMEIATQAARWGADIELEACCEILRGEFNYHHLAEPLRAARRPKPPSLKEQALAALETQFAKEFMESGERDIIRRAIESLPS